MKKFVGLVLMLLLLTGCSVPRISLDEAEMRLESDRSVLELTLSNPGNLLRIYPWGAILRDGTGMEYGVVDVMGDLEQELGQGYFEEITGTIIFPALDPLTNEVEIVFKSHMVNEDYGYTTKIESEMVDGVSVEFEFGRELSSH